VGLPNWDEALLMAEFMKQNECIIRLIFSNILITPNFAQTFDGWFIYFDTHASQAFKELPHYKAFLQSLQNLSNFLNNPANANVAFWLRCLTVALPERVRYIVRGGLLGAWHFPITENGVRNQLDLYSLGGNFQVGSEYFDGNVNVNFRTTVLPLRLELEMANANYIPY
jgi:hypothetical protein